MEIIIKPVIWCIKILKIYNLKSGLFFGLEVLLKPKEIKAAIHDLISWSEDISKTGRETQKQFLQFCLNFFRQALLLNYNANDLVYFRT